LVLFLRILRCFTSPRIARPILCIQTGATPYDRCRVSPFGNLRIKACVPLPEAYRSLLRPSSPDEAKASINCCNWFMQTLTYSRRLFYPLTLKTTLNFQRTKLDHSIYHASPPFSAGPSSSRPVSVPPRRDSDAASLRYRWLAEP